MEGLDETFSDLASFSLSNSSGESLTGGTKCDYTFLIYLGAALLIIIVGLFIYKFYLNQKKVRFSEENYSIDADNGNDNDKKCFKGVCSF